MTELKDVWFLGDTFLREAHYTYKSMINQAVNKGLDRPYLAANYNTTALYAEKLINMNAFLARILNAFIDGLNNPLKHHLPCYVIIMLDKDLIHNAKVFDYGVSRTFEDTLKWLLVNINRCVEICKKDLKQKRKGAVSLTSEP